jgi:hypothetical protein
MGRLANSGQWIQCHAPLGLEASRLSQAFSLQFGWLRFLLLANLAVCDYNVSPEDCDEEPHCSDW